MTSRFLLGSKAQTKPFMMVRNLPFTLMCLCEYMHASQVTEEGGNKRHPLVIFHLLNLTFPRVAARYEVRSDHGGVATCRAAAFGHLP